MAQTIKIRETVYQNVPSVEIPLSPGPGNAEFYDTSDATMTSGGQMLSGVSAYANGVKYSGSITTNTGTDVTVSGATVTVPSGYYGSEVQKSVTSGSVTAPATITGTSASVSTGSNTLTLTKTISVTPSVTTAGYISSGTAGNSSVSLTASVTTKAAATLQPGTSAVTIASGKIFLKADGSIATGTASGGGGIGLTLIDTHTLTLDNYKTTTAANFTSYNITGFDRDKILYVRIRNGTPWTNGTYYGSDSFVRLQPSSSNTTYARFDYPINYYHNGGNPRGASNGSYGIFPYQLTYETGELIIRDRYNSSYTQTLDGTYTIKCYVMDNPVDNPFDTL